MTSHNKPTMTDYLIAHIGHTTKWCEHITWWKPDSRGYTICIDKAGLYGEEEARSICQHGSCIAVPKDVAEKLARSTPYYRLSNGNLARLYDGGPHRPVPNSREAWKALLAKNLPSSGRTERVTPISVVKARAVYLDACAEVVVTIDGHQIKVADVLRRVIRGLKPKRGKPKWYAVHEATAHGSTVSMGLCQWAGVDPDGEA